MKYRREEKRNEKQQHNEEFINTKTKRNDTSHRNVKHSLGRIHASINGEILTAQHRSAQLNRVQHNNVPELVCYCETEWNLCIEYVGGKKTAPILIKSNVPMFLYLVLNTVSFWFSWNFDCEWELCFACICVTMHTIVCLKIHVITRFNLLIHIYFRMVNAYFYTQTVWIDWVTAFAQTTVHTENNTIRICAYGWIYLWIVDKRAHRNERLSMNW